MLTPIRAATSLWASAYCLRASASCWPRASACSRREPASTSAASAPAEYSSCSGSPSPAGSSSACLLLGPPCHRCSRGRAVQPEECPAVFGQPVDGVLQTGRVGPGPVAPRSTRGRRPRRAPDPRRARSSRRAGPGVSGKGAPGSTASTVAGASAAGGFSGPLGRTVNSRQVTIRPAFRTPRDFGIVERSRATQCQHRPDGSGRSRSTTDCGRWVPLLAHRGSVWLGFLPSSAQPVDSAVSTEPAVGAFFCPSITFPSLPSPTPTNSWLISFSVVDRFPDSNA